jgi:uncharacterized protein
MRRIVPKADEIVLDEEQPPKRPGSYRALQFGLAGASLLLLWPSWAAFYTEWLWFREVGFEAVFSTVLTTKVLLAVTVGLIAATVLWLNFKIALRLSPAEWLPFHPLELQGEMVQLPDFGKLVAQLATAVALAAGLFLGFQAWAMWDTYLRYRHQLPFGEADPIFQRDIAFYIFTLPALESVSGLLLALVMTCLVGVGAIYAARSNSPADGRRFPLVLQTGQRAHALSILAVLFLALAWNAYLAAPGLLFSRAGPVLGASYTDIVARLPLLRAEVFAALLVAILATVSILRSRNGLLWAGVGLYIAVVLGGWAYPAVVQRFSVGPNELAKETPYIQFNIAATRKAFGLESIEERELRGDSALTRSDISANQRTINNVRLWDQQPLLDTFAQIQEIRTYYDFQSVDNDRYRINGETQQVMLSARELSASSLPNRNWINERLTFTHGFGLTLGPVNQATAEGLPVLYIKDIPPVSSLPSSFRIQRPEIYFGETSSDHVYVKTSAKEFDYPSGEENVFAAYAGDGGVSIGTIWRQLLFATRFADMKLLLSNDLTPESRVLFHRNIQDRLRQVAPFLRFDSDPYMVISEGRLFWMADAYTVSDRYPYSQPVAGGINFIRNSVKAVVDAYHGDMTLYIADKDDPLVQTYARIFPGILHSLDEMPADLRAHLRYPEDIFKIQAAVYSTYHMDQPQVFYNKEDQWNVPSTAGTGSEGQTQVMAPYYTIMKLPEEATEEFILMLPFTPALKDNLAAWMAARADGDNYGRLVVYRFPKQMLVYGPKQIMARINQDPEISRQLTLWNQRGSQVILGNLMVIPIEKSLIYVQALYLRAEAGKIPELRRVIVAAENRIAMEPTLEASIAAIFGSTTPQPAPQPIETPANTTTHTEAQGLFGLARQHYDSALQAQREGDWARYGEEIRKLGAVLERFPQ